MSTLPARQPFHRGGDTVKKAPILKMLPLLQVFLLAACGTDSTQRVLGPSGEFKATSQFDDDRDVVEARFSAWSAPVNVGAPVNTAFAEQTPTISRNGLTLYLTCLSCPGGYGGNDIWAAERTSVDGPWGTPRNLGPEINTAANEGAPALSRDGHRLFFDSDRPGGAGGFDLYVARRKHKRDKLSWQAPVNLGAGINTTANEQGAEYLARNEDDHESEAATLYFTSNRVGGPGNEDVYSIALHSDGTFELPMLAEGLNTPSRESGPAIRRDGLEIYFVSDRLGGFGGVDLWVATRQSISDAWSTPVNLGPLINSDKNDAGPALSFDARSLYFHSPRPGNVGGLFFDLFVVTREKLRGRERG
jgi:Tol biopolymer transport system component